MGFRIVDKKTGKSSAVGYHDFPGWLDITKKRIYDEFKAGRIGLFCDCSEKNELPLMITKDFVIRVAENGRQDAHKEYCPKSESYALWSLRNGKGGVALDNGGMFLQVAIPALFPKKEKPEEEYDSLVEEEEDEGEYVSSEEESSVNDSDDKNQKMIEEKEKQEDKIHKSSLQKMIYYLSCMSFERQGWSIKKKMRESKENGTQLETRYKNSEDFRKLMFGVSNDIVLNIRSQNIAFGDVLYRKDTFYDESTAIGPYLIYAEVTKINYKKDRKYQYVTVKMSGKIKGTDSYRTTIRIYDKVFNKIFCPSEKLNYLQNVTADYAEMVQIDGVTIYLTGWVRRDVWNQNGEYSVWCTMIKGTLTFAEATCGLYVESKFEAAVIGGLVRRNVLFECPYLPLVLHNTNGEDVTIDVNIVMKRYRRKSLAVVLVSSKRKYELNYLQYADMHFDKFELLIYHPGMMSGEDVAADLEEKLMI